MKLVMMFVQIWFLDGTYDTHRVYYDDMDQCNIIAHINSGRYNYHMYSYKIPRTIQSYKIKCVDLTNGWMRGRRN